MVHIVLLRGSIQFSTASALELVNSLARGPIPVVHMFPSLGTWRDLVSRVFVSFIISGWSGPSKWCLPLRCSFHDREVERAWAHNLREHTVCLFKDGQALLHWTVDHEVNLPSQH